jgi:hypothetical protein
MAELHPATSIKRPSRCGSAAPDLREEDLDAQSWKPTSPSASELPGEPGRGSWADGVAEHEGETVAIAWSAPSPLNPAMPVTASASNWAYRT